MPVYAGDTESVKRGAIAAVGLDYYDIGWQAGNIVVRILRGEQPGEIPVMVAEETSLYVNPAVAAEMGLTIPEHVLSRADEVVR
jgi:putative ABC transport system substrate-binding protein